MGMYLDKGNAGFQSVLNSDFVDKSGVLNILNKSIDTENRFICVSRPRRFGKSVAAKMAYAYYDRKSDSRKQFENLEISKSPDYEKFLNKYPTIYIDFNDFAHINKKEVITKFQKIVITDLKKSYPDLKEENNLKFALDEIHDTTGDKFVLIIDEWDMNIREVEKDVQTEYVNFLRAMFKSINALEVFALVYMTGILPILKIEAQSALNNFREFSMINPGRTAKYYGFTEMEVKKLCETHNMDLALMKHAYDGYIIGDEPSMFNPNSVMQSISNGNYISYWSKSASYTTIEPYIKFDDGTDSVRQKV
ncbi:MAG: AAA family ATPase, partial [Bacteroidales bacterium]|nr:AAA family ATPase [Bacteroidales bacterium]